MATQSFTIVSRYDFPENDKGRLEEEAEDISDDESGWSKGHTFGPSKRAANPPKFVKSSGLYDDFGGPKQDEEDEEIQIIDYKPANIGQWYQNLNRTNSGQPTPQRQATATSAKAGSNTAASDPTTKLKDPSVPWFISNVVQSSSPSGSSTPQFASSSMPDLLARAPPPLPHETRFVPPVFTALGPANRGYEMLERHGWREGETLGIGASRFAVKQELKASSAPSSSKGKEKAPEMVDLTLDDSDDEDLVVGMPTVPAPPTLSRSQNLSDHSGRALLTPLPTVLRGDKSGLGSRKTVKKTIVNTSQAVHLVESMDRRKRHQERISNPKARDVIRKMKRDQRDRDAMLQYMKAD